MQPKEGIIVALQAFFIPKPELRNELMLYVPPLACGRQAGPL
jgi:hypothetical protein